MITIIKQVFLKSGYECKEINNVHILKHKEDDKKQYWIIVEDDVANIIEKQPSYFKLCKQVYQYEDVDKNLSMLILWNTKEGDIDKLILKNTKMEIEENPFFFKKYALAYSTKEIEDLKRNISDKDCYEFIIKQAIDNEIFDRYKVNTSDQTWEALLYRIMIKLPFLPVVMENDASLQPLFKEKDEAVAAKHLSSIDKLIDTEFDSVLSGDLDINKADSKIFNKLKSLLGEDIHGNQNQ